MSCEYCTVADDPGGVIPTHAQCCWAKAMKIKRFKRRVKYKFIVQVVFDMIVSITSVVTDIIALVMYFINGSYTLAILTLIPVLLPTFVFTNVYLTDDTVPIQMVPRDAPVSGKKKKRKVETSRKKKEKVEDADGVSVASSNTDSSLRTRGRSGLFKCEQQCRFHWGCCRVPVEFWRGCCGGFWQCLCNPDYKLRRSGAHLVNKSFKRMVKYGFGTFLLRFIAISWYVKALIYGIKAYREPKRFMKIESPENHWSHELLVRLDFLQAALENAPQCVIQMFALMTRMDKNIALGALTLIFSFVDFVRISVSVHWDMNKGPVLAPTGCYKTFWWIFINTSSWILIYISRSAGIALIFATCLSIEDTNLYVLIPTIIFIIHFFLFGKLLSKAEYGVAAQKVFVAVFISFFFLPELDSSMVPAIIQFFYATMIIENALFILPWDGFDSVFCVSSGERMNKTNKPPPPTTTVPPEDLWEPRPSNGYRPTASGPVFGVRWEIDGAITGPDSTTPRSNENVSCFLDHTSMALAIPSLAIVGVTFRILASHKMVKFKKNLPRNNEERDRTQNKLESSIANIFSKKWSKMSVREMFGAFLRMLKKEVYIPDPPSDNDNGGPEINVISAEGNKEGFPKRFSFLAAKLHEELLASQSIMQKTFLSRSTRSHDIRFAALQDKHEETPPPEYNSDTDIVTFRQSNVKKRPRLPRSRNVSEGVDATTDPENSVAVVQMEFPQLGTHFVETCWV